MNKTGTSFGRTGNKFSIQKLELAYINTLEQMVQILAGLIMSLCSQQNIQRDHLRKLNQLHSELKYHEKMKNQGNNNSFKLNMIVQEALDSLKAKSDQFPKIKQMKSHNKAELQTIAEIFIRKGSHHKAKHRNISQLQKHSETIDTTGQVYREETRRSLDNNNKSNNKKPIYLQLQRLKTKDRQLYNRYDPNSKRMNTRTRLPTYNISKLI